MKSKDVLRRWLLGWVFFAILGLQLIESAHHHESAARQEACVLCQAVAHYPFDLAPPEVALAAAVLFLLFTLPYRQSSCLVVAASHAAYRSRAPPLSRTV